MTSYAIFSTESNLPRVELSRLPFFPVFGGPELQVRRKSVEVWNTAIALF